MKDLTIVSNDIDSIGIEQLITAFFSGKNPNTLNAYKIDLKDFCKFLNMDNISMATKALISSGQGAANLKVLQYKNSMIERGLSPATINRRLSAIRSLLKLSRTLGIINWSIEIQNQKSQSYRDTRGPNSNKIQDIITGLQISDSPKNKRDIAIVSLLYVLGLRVSELVNLDLSDLDFENQRLSIIGKGRAEKEYLSIPDSVIEVLESWLRVRTINSGDAVFLNFSRSKNSGKRVTRFGVYKIISRLGVDNDIKLSPHQIRHSSISVAVAESQKKNIGLREVLRFSRHKSLSVLQKYVDSLDNYQGEIANLVQNSINLKKAD